MKAGLRPSGSEPSRRVPLTGRIPLKNLTEEYHQNANLVTNSLNQVWSQHEQLSPRRKTTHEAKSQLKGCLLRKRWEEEIICLIKQMLGGISLGQLEPSTHTIQMVLLMAPRHFNPVGSNFPESMRTCNSLKLGSVTWFP